MPTTYAEPIFKRFHRALVAVAILGAGALAACGTDATSSRHQQVAADGACVSCHRSEYRSARHHEGRKPTTCAICHAQSDWKPSRLDHPWELTGKHTLVDCFGCHTGEPPTFHGTSKKCVDCHRKEYDRAHPDERKPTKCESCHLTTGWADWDRTREPDPPPKPKEPEKPEVPAPSASVSAIPSTVPTVVRPHPHPHPVPTTKPSTAPQLVPVGPDITTHASRPGG
jgi:hypothetical protein